MRQRNTTTHRRKTAKPQLVRVAEAIGATLGTIVAKADGAKNALVEEIGAARKEVKLRTRRTPNKNRKTRTRKARGPRAASRRSK